MSGGTGSDLLLGNAPEELPQIGNVADAAAQDAFKGREWQFDAYVRGRDGHVFTAPVGQFEPNAWGLFDMHGNAWEWCQDWYESWYYLAGPQENPAGPDEGPQRVARGGGFNRPRAASAMRSGSLPEFRFYDLGFRVARSLRAEPPPISPDTPSDRTAAEWALSAGGSLVIVVDGTERTIPAGGSLPDGDFRLIGMAFRNKLIDFDALARFGTGLQSLSVRALPLSEAALARIGRLTQLRQLDLFESAVTDAGVAHLKNLRGLQVLSLQRTRAGDGALVHVAGFERLVHLNLSDTRVTDDGMSAVRSLHQLNELYAAGTRLTGRFATHLQELKLKSLIIGNMRTIDEEGFRHIAALPHLESLKMSVMPVPDAWFRSFASHPALQVLRIDRIDISDAVIPHLAAIPMLREASLSHTGITAAGIAELRQAKPDCRILGWQAPAASGPAARRAGWHGWPADAPPPAIAPFDAARAQAHQQAWANYLRLPEEYTSSIGIRFRLIPPGRFVMGAAPEEIVAAIQELEQHQSRAAADTQHAEFLAGHIQAEGPAHDVILTQPFYLAIHEVTQQQYETITEANPSSWSPRGSNASRLKGRDHRRLPVDSISWTEAAEFCAKLNIRDGLAQVYGRGGRKNVLQDVGYCLPTEAQWEFACRAGTTTRFWAGDTPQDLARTAWFVENSGRAPHPVGELPGNPFGLCDMHGNLNEWVEDGWNANAYARYSDVPAIDPQFASGDYAVRVFRGGVNFSQAYECRSSARHAWPAVYRPGLGFRVALPIDAARKLIERASRTGAGR